MRGIVGRQSFADSKLKTGGMGIPRYYQEAVKYSQYACAPYSRTMRDVKLVA